MTNEPFEEQEAPVPGPEDTAEAVDVEALKAERDTLHDRLLRTAAEFDNYRKRIDRERREQADAAATSLLTEVLPVVDNLERALLAPATPESAGYRAGVELIHRQLVDLLRKRGVTPIEALGTDFDPRIHQAVSHESSDAHRDGEVMEELQRGYMLGERLLRPSMVKVAKS
jgi:molecular chaperone GrpE